MKVELADDGALYKVTRPDGSETYLDHQEIVALAAGSLFEKAQCRVPAGSPKGGEFCSAGSFFSAPQNFTLADSEYDVNTKYPLDMMVVADVDLGLLSSEYGADYRVRSMATDIQEGKAKFPPLTLELTERGALKVLDGRTRIAALRESGITTGTVPAVIRLFDQGVEGSLPQGVSVDSKRTTSLRGGVAKSSFGLSIFGQLVEKRNPYKDRLGRFASAPGGGSAGVKAVVHRAYTGEQVNVRARWSKLETGEHSEKVAAEALKKIGIEAKSVNVKGNNAAFDLLGKDKDGKVVAVEVKGGLVSNGSSAQHWRATLGQPGPKEALALRKMSPEQKARHHAAKQKEILRRKDRLAKAVGAKKKMTVGVITNPDTGVSDVHVLTGFHLRVSWSSPLAKQSYVGSFKAS